LFAQDDAERNKLSDSRRSTIRLRLEARLAQLEAAETFPWADPLDAVHEENRFQRDTKILGEDGAFLWARFDREMERLYSTQPTPDARAAGATR
jgi:TolB-like protein